jgi:hypothetical protein
MAQDQPDASTEQQSGDENADVDMVIRGPTEGGLVLYGEPVKRFFAPDISGWHVLDNQRLILYATRSRPYLVTLRRKAFGLNQSTVIGVRRSSSTFDARFDSIIVDDFRYAIERIEKLTPEVAKRLRGIEPKPEELAPEEDPESG